MSRLPRSRRARRLVAATLLGATVALSTTAGATAITPGSASTSTEVSSTITRATVIARAVSWVAQGVPYSQTRWWSDGNGTYRQDCSGYVAMAWGLDQHTNYWTGNLATVSSRIPAGSMLPGDILLLPGDHTVIFAGWTDAARTRFNLYEQFAPGYVARYQAGASLETYLARGFGAYRYDRITG